jgi:hypothetical protein
MKAFMPEPLRRVARMDRGELRFRLACEWHKVLGRTQWMLSRPRWRREDLIRILAPAHASNSSELAESRQAARAGDWLQAHRALAAHFAARSSAFPFDPHMAGPASTRIRERFPRAAGESASRADNIIAGHYDILGYRAVPFGRPPRWNHDPVHDRTAPPGFWASVPYLDPASGDHKIIWEVNRHQHWLALGRAFHLTSSRRFYEEFVTQLEDWLPANPPLTGANWASMLELGFRSLSWVWALQLFAAAADRSDPHPWTVDLIVGLDRQLTHVEQNLSRYFSPNTHLTGEALALYVAAAAIPELAGSERRLALGREVLLTDIDRQVRADGGHVELSAHYHRYSTDFYILATLVARAAGDPAAGAFQEAASRQARYLRALADDTGRLPLIGDDDGGQLFPICGREPVDCRDTLASAAVLLDEPGLAIGEVPEETMWLCGKLPVDRIAASERAPQSTALPDSGYYVSRNSRGDHLIVDAGPHGFLNGGHAHSDALSVILSVAGRPLLVDPGTATYTMDPSVRDLFRSTAMHNTVVVNGRPQSETRGPFHWQSTAQAHASVWRTAPGADYIEGRHDAYAPIVHTRGVLALHGVGWFVVDHFSGGTDAMTEAMWHVHPDWHAVAGSEGVVTLEHRDGVILKAAASAPIEILAADDGRLGSYAPAYGRIERAPCLRCRTTGALPRAVMTFLPAELASDDVDVTVQMVPVDRPAPESWLTAAFRVRCRGTEMLLLSAVECAGAGGVEGGGSPGQTWGIGEATTDARLALLSLEGEHPADGVLVNGRRLGTPAGTLDLGLSTPIARVAVERAAPRPYSGLKRARLSD